MASQITNEMEKPILAQLFDEVVVFLVHANPKPHNQIALPARKGAIMISDSGGPYICDQRLELH
jgi:hypothetical protein